MGHTGRPAADEHAPYYGKYIALVPAGDLVEVLRSQEPELVALLQSFAGDAAERGYAPGKWTVKEVVGHLSDVERVMGYRALRIARGDATPLPGFDENAYTPAGAFGARTLDDLIDELLAVRAATVALFGGLPADAWERRGTFSDGPGTTRALACIIAGHTLHHAEILRTRYRV
jgi:DinB superfamily